MLVFSRKKNEAVLVKVGDVTVRVIVSSIEHGKVRIGFDAPKEVNILREEVANRFKREVK